MSRGLFGGNVAGICVIYFPKELWENDSEISGNLAKCFTPDLFTARAKAWINDRVTTNPKKPFFRVMVEVP